MSVQWVHHAKPLPWLVLMLMFEHANGVRVTVRGTVHDERTYLLDMVLSLIASFRQGFMKAPGDHVHPEERPLFKAGYPSSHALTSLAIGGAMGHVALWPCLDQLVMSKAFEAVLELRPRMPHNWRQALGQGALFPPKLQLPLKVRPTWRRKLQGAGYVSKAGLAAGGYAIACPSGCGGEITLTGRPLRQGSRWPKVWCGHCAREARAGKARCKLCDELVPTCQCTRSKGAYAGPARRQADIRSFF